MTEIAIFVIHRVIYIQYELQVEMYLTLEHVRLLLAMYLPLSLFADKKKDIGYARGTDRITG